MAANSVDSTKAPVSRPQPPVSTPWTKIVRGTAESDLIASAPHLPSDLKLEAGIRSIPIGEQEVISNGNAGKRSSSNVSSDGPLRPVEAGASIEAQSWPALSDSTRSLSRSSSESAKSLVDGVSSISISEGSVTTSQGQAGDHRIANLNPNPAAPTRQRSINKRNNATSSGGVTQLPSLLDQSTDMPTNRVSPRYHNQRSNLTSQTQSSNEHPRPRSNSFRNRNGGTRGEGFHHQNFGNRHEQERGSQEWNPHRSFGTAREAHLQQHIPGPIRPPPPPIPYAPFSPSQMWPYGSPMGYPELGSPMYYLQAPPSDLRAVPLPLSPHAVYFPFTDPQLLIKISNQIDYYFSEENLIKDTYLRQNMDDQGWVSISLIASFKKILNLTDNVKIILDAIQTSATVEVQGEKVRRRNDWRRWIMPPTYQYSSNPTTQVP